MREVDGYLGRPPEVKLSLGYEQPTADTVSTGSEMCGPSCHFGPATGDPPEVPCSGPGTPTCDDQLLRERVKAHQELLLCKRVRAQQWVLLYQNCTEAPTEGFGMQYELHIARISYFAAWCALASKDGGHLTIPTRKANRRKKKR